MCSMGWIRLGLIASPWSILVRGESEMRSSFYYRLFVGIRSVAHTRAEQPATIFGLDLARHRGFAYENGLQRHFHAKYGGPPISIVVAISSAVLHVLRAVSVLVPCRSSDLCYD